LAEKKVVWVKKFWRNKSIGVKKVLAEKKVFWEKKFWRNKNIGVKKFWHKKTFLT